MMRIKIGLALVAALVFSVGATASASATPSFLSSTKGKLESLNVATQVFVTESGTTECTEAIIKAGESSGEQTPTQRATIEYKKCTAFGFVTVTITPAEYDFHANGQVSILKLISIKTVGCEVSVPAQTVGKVDYQNSGKNILLEPLVTGILYTGAGSSCTKSGEFKNGTYKGHSEVMIPNATLSFMAKGEVAGEAVELESSVVGEVPEIIPNPYDLAVKITKPLVPVFNGGVIMNEGTCKVGATIAALSSCSYEQAPPPFAVLDATFI